MKLHLAELVIGVALMSSSFHEKQAGRSVSQRLKAAKRRSRELADRTQIGLEPLEPRLLMAGIPTLIDLVPGGGASTPSNFTNVNNIAFFVATDPTNGTELWKSDGTAAGTLKWTPIFGPRAGDF